MADGQMQECQIKIYEVLKEIASYQNSKECSGTEIGVQF